MFNPILEQLGFLKKVMEPDESLRIEMAQNGSGKIEVWAKGVQVAWTNFAQPSDLTESLAAVFNKLTD